MAKPYQPPANLHGLSPAWQWDGKGDIRPSPNSVDPRLSGMFPPAWHWGATAPSVSKPSPTPTTVVVPMPLPAPIPQLPPLPPIIAAPIPAAIPIPIQLPSLPPFVLPPEIIPVTPVTPGPSVPNPAASTSWRSVIVAALAAVAKEKSNSQFLTWANVPRDIFALVRSESGGAWDAVKDEGFSSKLGRSFYSFGLFQNNELFGRDRYVNAPNAIGAANAALMVPFPATATWTKAQAAAALLAVPQQVWYGMVLLRSFSLYKNTYYATLQGSVATPGTGPSALANPSTLATVKATIPFLLSEHQRTGAPVQALALKAFWLASSPGGVKSILSKQDVRITRFAAEWKAEPP